MQLVSSQDKAKQRYGQLIWACQRTPLGGGGGGGAI